MNADLQRIFDELARNFFSRKAIQVRKNRIDQSQANIEHEVLEGKTWCIQITTHQGVKHVISIPLPYTEDGLTLIGQDVVRPYCPFFLVSEERILHYTEIIEKVLFGSVSDILPSTISKPKSVNFSAQIGSALLWNTMAITVKSIQTVINFLVNKMPIHKTAMNSWAMNHRLTVLDPSFDVLSSPAERHAYQVDKNRYYFDKYGWTSVGLSDSSLADSNYILTVDLRDTIPFGRGYHNPQRNLYSTLGMQGDELPTIRSATMQHLIDRGITRTGWNLLTAFVDVPDVWEDQIMVDASLMKLFAERKRRYQLFGEILVSKGEKLKLNKPMAIAPDGEKTFFDVLSDEAWVHSVTKTTVVVGGVPTDAHNVIVKFRRNIKEGTKITNLAANKGVVRVVDGLGYAVDPRNGEKRKLEVLVSSGAVDKRHNFTQVLEALANNLFDEEVAVFTDDANVSVTSLKSKLAEKGFPDDGTWAINTYAGEFSAVVGNVFWGITKDVEDAIWHEGATERLNGRGLRDAGLKFSTVEMRALNTRFGSSNPIVSEIMEHVQGTEDLHELLTMVRCHREIYLEDKHTIDVKDVLCAKTESSIIQYPSGTIVDHNYVPEGFYLKLPVEICIIEKEASNETVYRGPINGATDDQIRDNLVYNVDRIYVPSSNLRKCWRHSTGKYGLSEVGSVLNNLVMLSHKYMMDPNDGSSISLLFGAINRYFDLPCRMLGTKRGAISTLGMSVRYPHAVKAVATLSNVLPRNTVEVHRDLANRAGIKDGEVCLVERFPCLGFTCIRPQKIKIHDDPTAKYTIRASGSSLVSTGLDFDGDVLYIASFKNADSRMLLEKEWRNPNKSCYKAIKALNTKAGKPHFRECTIDSYGIHRFEALTPTSQAEIVNKLTGVKSNTGPVVALAYNIMRMIENSKVSGNQKINCGVEVFLDKVANSVFKQKHGEKALSDVVVAAVCTADVETLVGEGFSRSTSQIVCDIVTQKAAEIGVNDLISYHKYVEENGGSNVINRIIRKQNKHYFASRSILCPGALLECISGDPNDIPSMLLRWALSSKALERREEMINDKNLNETQDKNFHTVGDTLCAAFKTSEDIIAESFAVIRGGISGR